MSHTESRPQRFCDMVMKGGITSGIVYPLAIVKLSERFVFKNIGGTSAGAIAAAATAAAELARDRGGFEELVKLPKFLGENVPGTSRNNLFAFFQPQHHTARLFRVCVAGLGGGSKAVVSVCVRLIAEFWLAILIGALPGIAFIALALRETHGVFRVVSETVGILLLFTGAILGLALHLLLIIAHALPQNFYGLCSGMTDVSACAADNNSHLSGKPLTVWLTDYLDGFVDPNVMSQPLTFGELWGNDPDDPHRINLEMMTTCLTHGRPYRLPFRDDADVRENRFYFRCDEFQRLFPKSVVDWMMNHPRSQKDFSEKASQRREELRKEGFYPLPDPADLPVVVAVRMSLSFPILLSAIPLYDFDRSRDPDGMKPERCWFSDGGVCSNFPLHFFDSPFPRWPTLGIDLKQMLPGTDPAEFRKPQMVGSNSAGIQESWDRFEFVERVNGTTPNAIVSREKSGFRKLTGFAGALIGTMQNWSDNTLSRLPGYRDRIRPVPLSPDEGGLNLNMPEKRITALTERGSDAGEELIARFSVPATQPKMNWNNHRWLRMRSSLASLETMLTEIDRACAEPLPGDTDFETWVAETPPTNVPSYPWNKSQQSVAVEMIRGMRKIIAESNKIGANVTDGSPRPRGELRRRAHT
jgi:predicted acylesterase/phospholipase RssA